MSQYHIVEPGAFHTDVVGRLFDPNGRFGSKQKGILPKSYVKALKKLGVHWHPPDYKLLTHEQPFGTVSGYMQIGHSHTSGHHNEQRFEIVIKSIEINSKNTDDMNKHVHSDHIDKTTDELLVDTDDGPTSKPSRFSIFPKKTKSTKDDDEDREKTREVIAEYLREEKKKEETVRAKNAADATTRNNEIQKVVESYARPSPGYDHTRPYPGYDPHMPLPDLVHRRPHNGHAQRGYTEGGMGF